MEKILILTDVPPCDNYTAGIPLNRWIRFLPRDQVVLCAISDPTLKFAIPKDLESIPKLTLKKPPEGAIRITNRLGSIVRKLLRIHGFIAEIFRSLIVRYHLLPQIMKFIDEQKVTKIWVILQGQTIVRVAFHLSQKLDIVYFTQVWDPFELWINEHRIDKFTAKRLLQKFDQVIKKSEFCATASWTMSEHYSKKYKINTMPVFASLPGAWAQTPAKQPHSKDEFVIAMAGQFYAKEEWKALIEALNKANWSIAGKRIILRVMGSYFQFGTHLPVNFEYLGWRLQEDTISILNASDLLYLPYWFSKEYYLESTQCFPSKLATYFASGRPVFCHAPDYSSPAKYLSKHKASFLCNSLESQLIIKVLERAITDIESYSEITRNGTKCLLQDLTLEVMKNSIYKILKL